MGHHYRERHNVANTTTDNLAGLGAAPSPVPNTDWTLEQLRDAAKQADLPYYGTKAELIERLTTA